MSQQIKSFKDLGIKTEINTLKGDKIKIERILNKEIRVVKYRIEESKFKEKGNGKCLYFQILHNGTDHVVFSGSGVLMDQIQQVPTDAFTFITTITKTNDYFEFT